MVFGFDEAAAGSRGRLSGPAMNSTAFRVVLSSIPRPPPAICISAHTKKRKKTDTPREGWDTHTCTAASHFFYSPWGRSPVRAAPLSSRRGDARVASPPPPPPSSRGDIVSKLSLRPGGRRSSRAPTSSCEHPTAVRWHVWAAGGGGQAASSWVHRPGRAPGFTVRGTPSASRLSPFAQHCEEEKRRRWRRTRPCTRAISDGGI